MNGYNFTERVRKVLAMAREEAARLHHEYVGTEHILLGLIREGEGVAATVLQNLSVELDDVQQKIEETVKKGKAANTTGPDLDPARVDPRGGGRRCHRPPEPQRGAGRRPAKDRGNGQKGQSCQYHGSRPALYVPRQESPRAGDERGPRAQPQLRGH